MSQSTDEEARIRALEKRSEDLLRQIRALNDLLRRAQQQLAAIAGR